MKEEINKECQNLIIKMIQTPRCDPFKQPVDVEGLNLTNYYDIVKQPMDLSTIQKKLENNEYEELKDLRSDLELIFDNCILYNGRKGTLGKLAADLKRYSQINTKKIEEKSFLTRKPMKEKEECLKIVQLLSSKQFENINWPFLIPVDTKLIPNYLNVVKKPMDLKTVTEKIEKNLYEDKKDLENDLRQITTNCFLFNLPGTEVYECGKGFERLVRKHLTNVNLKSDEISGNILEIKNKIENLTKEIKDLEEQLIQKRSEEGLEQKRKSYTMEQRIKIASEVSKVSEDDALKIAKIIESHNPDFDIYNREVIEIDFKLLGDAVIEEIDSFIKNLGFKNEFAEDEESY